MTPKMNQNGAYLAISIILSYASMGVQASPETSNACFQAAEYLNDIESVNTAHDALLKGYNATCREAGLCYGEMADQLQSSLNEAAGNPADLFQTANTIPLTMTGTADFGGKFMSHESYPVYESECIKAGGTLGCVSGDIRLIGEVGGVLAEADGNSGGNDMDIEFYIKKFPICLPSECDDEDLKEVMVDATRDAVLNSPDVQGAITPATENILKTVTFESLCALGGPPTCELKIERVSCSGGSGSGSSSAHMKKIGSAFAMMLGSIAYLTL